jgi:hypothetical protein
MEIEAVIWSFNTNLQNLDSIALGPFFEHFLKKAGPEGLGRKNFKIWTQRIRISRNKN